MDNLDSPQPAIPPMKMWRRTPDAPPQARVLIRRRYHYLGPWDSAEARQRYGELIAAFLSSPSRSVVITVHGLIAEFMEWAKSEYRQARAGSAHGGEATNLKYPLRIVGEMYGTLEAGDFGLPQLAKVQDAFAGRGWTRRSVNRQINRVRSCWAWGASRGHVSPECAAALKLLRPIREGSGRVTEKPDVRAAPIDHVRAAAASASPAVVGEMIEMLLLTGMRVGELVRMRPVDIDRSGRVWLYQLEQHKTAHKAKTRIIAIGPRAQRVLAPRLSVCTKLDALVYVNTSGRMYEPRAFRRRVLRACELAEVPEFTTHQIRHTSATLPRTEGGLDAAQAMLGHTTATSTVKYAEAEPAAIALALAIG